jgi:hypothetical protein
VLFYRFGNVLGGQAFLIVVIGVGDDGFFFFGTDFADYTDFLALEGHSSALSVTCRGI